MKKIFLLFVFLFSTSSFGNLGEFQRSFPVLVDYVFTQVFEEISEEVLNLSEAEITRLNEIQKNALQKAVLIKLESSHSTMMKKMANIVADVLEMGKPNLKLSVEQNVAENVRGFLSFLQKSNVYSGYRVSDFTAQFYQEFVDIFKGENVDNSIREAFIKLKVFSSSNMMPHTISFNSLSELNFSRVANQNYPGIYKKLNLRSDNFKKTIKVFGNNFAHLETGIRLCYYKMISFHNSSVTDYISSSQLQRYLDFKYGGNVDLEMFKKQSYYFTDDLSTRVVNSVRLNRLFWSILKSPF